MPDLIPFTVNDNATRRRIGSISIMRITPAPGVAELGFIWYEPAAQRTKANTEANYLLLRPHSAVELVDRAEAAGLVRRVPDAADARVVRVELTNRGDQLVTRLTQKHLAELHKLAAVLGQLTERPNGAGPMPGAG